MFCIPATYTVLIPTNNIGNILKLGGLPMNSQSWCEHAEKISKYTMLNYDCSTKSVIIRIHSWFCPECGVHDALSEMINTLNFSSNDFGNG